MPVAHNKPYAKVAYLRFNYSCCSSLLKTFVTKFWRYISSFYLGKYPGRHSVYLTNKQVPEWFCYFIYLMYSYIYNSVKERMNDSYISEGLESDDIRATTLTLLEGILKDDEGREDRIASLREAMNGNKETEPETNTNTDTDTESEASEENTEEVSDENCEGPSEEEPESTEEASSEPSEEETEDTEENAEVIEEITEDAPFESEDAEKEGEEEI